MSNLSQSNQKSRPDVRSYNARGGGEAQSRVQYTVSSQPTRIKGLVLDYIGILDQSGESQSKWRGFMKRLVSHGVRVCVVYHDVMGTPEWFSPLSDLRDTGCAHSIIKTECDAFGSSISQEQVDDAASTLDLDPSECVFLSTDPDSVFNALDMHAMIHLVTSLDSALYFAESAFEEQLSERAPARDRSAA